MSPRFNPDCNTFVEVVEYYEKRAMQLKREKIEMFAIRELKYGVVAFFIDFSQQKYVYYYSLYLYKDFRGQGLFGKLNVNEHAPDKCASADFMLLTSNDCGLEDYIVSKGIQSKIVHFHSTINNAPYTLISNHYGSTKAKRSGVDYMNHIDEAFALLRLLNFEKPWSTIRAYCLHPILQSDSDLSDTVSNINDFDLKNIYHEDMIYAMEYRSVANEYLSKRKIDSIEEIRLSPLKVVNDMLILDKIQNRKDFDLYHKGTHERSDILTGYFDNWFKRLGITDKMYEDALLTLSIKYEVYKK